MAEKKPDRRVRRTRALLRQALTELLTERRDVRSITVQELTARADVNRGTFYAHYRDIYDMIEKTEQELFEELAALLDRYHPEELQRDLSPVLADVFRFVKKNQDLLPILLERQTADHFLMGLNRIIFDRCLSRWAGVYNVGKDRGGIYCLEFVVSGMVGLVRSWIQLGFQESPEEMAGTTAVLIRHGLNSAAVSGASDLQK